VCVGQIRPRGYFVHKIYTKLSTNLVDRVVQSWLYHVYTLYTCWLSRSTPWCSAMFECVQVCTHPCTAMCTRVQPGVLCTYTTAVTSILTYLIYYRKSLCVWDSCTYLGTAVLNLVQLCRSTGMLRNSNALLIFWPKTNRKKVPVPNLAHRYSKVYTLVYTAVHCSNQIPTARWTSASIPVFKNP
jgi:hypothetical protein